MSAIRDGGGRVTTMVRGFRQVTLALVLWGIAGLPVDAEEGGQRPPNGGRPDLEQLAKASIARSRALVEISRQEERTRRMRINMINQFIAYREQEKAKAGAERDEVLANRSRLERENELRRWALRQVDTANQVQVVHPQQRAKALARWDRVNKTTEDVFLNFKTQSRGAIKRGRAHNFLLNILAPVAIDHVLKRDQLLSEQRRLEQQIAELTKRGQPDSGAASLAEARRQLQDVQTKLEHLALLNRSGYLPRDAVMAVRFTSGAIGPKQVLTAADGALPLHWPPQLKKPRYDALRAAMTSARDAGLKSLEQGQGISIEVQNDLLESADKLYFEFQRDWHEFVDSNPDALTTNHYFEAKRFVKGLRDGVFRFVRSESISDVTVELDETNIKNWRIEDLMAFMSRQGLGFAEAPAKNEDQYVILFDQMVAYLKSIHSAQQAHRYEMARTETEMQRLDVESQKLFDVQFRHYANALQMSVEDRPPVVVERKGKDSQGDSSDSLSNELMRDFLGGVAQGLGEKVVDKLTEGNSGNN